MSKKHNHTKALVAIAAHFINKRKAIEELPNLEGNPNRCVYYNVSFPKWKRELRKQQLYYPALKFQKLDDEMLKHYYNEGFEPIDACNDMLTAT